jgi:hypothetical protein
VGQGDPPLRHTKRGANPAQKGGQTRHKKGRKPGTKRGGALAPCPRSIPRSTPRRVARARARRHNHPHLRLRRKIKTATSPTSAHGAKSTDPTATPDHPPGSWHAPNASARSANRSATWISRPSANAKPRSLTRWSRSPCSRRNPHRHPSDTPTKPTGPNAPIELPTPNVIEQLIELPADDAYALGRHVAEPVVDQPVEPTARIVVPAATIGLTRSSASLTRSTSYAAQTHRPHAPWPYAPHRPHCRDFDASRPRSPESSAVKK